MAEDKPEDKIERLRSMIDECSKIVFFGGAGVSTESGIPDFRSPDGLYNQKYSLPPEEIVSKSYFFAHTKEFYDFYRDKMIYTEAKPNAAHIYLADLERRGKLLSVVTQNIDGLHQAAGSKKVRELHGSVHQNHCLRCGKFYDLSAITESAGVPKCSCGGTIKPDVVLYEESLDPETIDLAVADISAADMLIIGGTSLSVYPAASFIYYFKGKYLVMINRTSTSADERADLVIRDSIGEVFSKLQES